MAVKRLLGIDTSKHQASKVDYNKFKKSGGSFVFLRVGCGSTKDKCFEADYAAAVAAGLKVGAYFYTYSTTEASARIDASRVLGWLNGRKLDLPVVYDIEDDKQNGSSKRFSNSLMYNAFAAVIKAAGYQTMLYTGEFFFNAYFYKDSITDELWIAKYSSKQPSVGKDYRVWQFSSDKIDTDYYKGALDRNYMYVDGDEVSSENNGNTNPYPVPTRTLKKTIPCMKGNDVKWLQTELNRHGLIEHGGVDGIFGPKTLAAVRVYQEQHGLLVDGKVGPATRYSLSNS